MEQNNQDETRETGGQDPSRERPRGDRQRLGDSSSLSSVILTINNYNEEDLRRLRELPYNYLVFGREVAPSTGTPHIQGFVQFRGRIKFRKLRKLLANRAYLERPMGAPLDCANYCKKGEQSHQEWKSRNINGPNYGVGADYEEYGEVEDNRGPHASGSGGGRIEIERYQRARRLAQAGDLESIDADIYVRHYHTLCRIRDDNKPRPATREDEENFWVHGPTGVGKSHGVRDIWPDAYLKPLNRWWDNYKGEDTAIIEEWDPEIGKKLANHLKIWADKFPFKAEIKQSHRDIRPGRIVVVSNYNIRECFPERKDYEALERKFEEIEVRAYDAENKRFIREGEENYSYQQIQAFSEGVSREQERERAEKRVREAMERTGYLSSPVQLAQQSAPLPASSPREEALISQEELADPEDFFFEPPHESPQEPPAEGPTDEEMEREFLESETHRVTQEIVNSTEVLGPDAWEPDFSEDPQRNPRLIREENRVYSDGEVQNQDPGDEFNFDLDLEQVNLNNLFGAQDRERWDQHPNHNNFN